MAGEYEVCYFKKICNTQSKEGLAFLRRFELDVEYCRDKCGGQEIRCGKYVTQQEVNAGGLVKLVKK